nr:Wzt carbohydrate-binding domain-containing protein [Methylomarinum sp. Ch1-1]MDP4522850.1 Wzt carbohydrate-binding domain-containing protein [Methylomarinum sp. Ch1-1]
MQATYGDTAKLNSTEKSQSESTEAQSDYLDQTAAQIDYHATFSVQDNMDYAKGWKTESAEIIAIDFEKLDSQIENVFHGGERVRVIIHAKANQELIKPILGFIVRDRLGQDLFGENTLSFTDLHPCSIQAGQHFIGEFVFRLPMLPNGEYAVMASVADGDHHENLQHHYLHNALILNVSSSKVRYGLVGIQFEEVILKSAE